MKEPILILKKGSVSRKHISDLKKNGICVIEAEDPSAVRFVEPPPLGYSVHERAAINLSRYLLEHRSYMYSRDNIAALYCHFIIQGSPLEPVKSVTKAKT